MHREEHSEEHREEHREEQGMKEKKRKREKEKKKLAEKNDKMLGHDYELWNNTPTQQTYRTPSLFLLLLHNTTHNSCMLCPNLALQATARQNGGEK
tara:strand:- start:125 stop:412 length:288 start_codon:yes stop_codon:yes gene_type:complete